MAPATSHERQAPGALRPDTNVVDIKGDSVAGEASTERDLAGTIQHKRVKCWEIVGTEIDAVRRAGCLAATAGDQRQASRAFRPEAYLIYALYARADKVTSKRCLAGVVQDGRREPAVGHAFGRLWREAGTLSAAADGVPVGSFAMGEAQTKAPDVLADCVNTL